MQFVTALLALLLAPVAPPTPNRQPQVASAGGVVALTFGSGDAIWFARSNDNGRSFAPPVKVASMPKLMSGCHRGPRVAIAGNTILVSAIPSAGDLLLWRSSDGGKTWSQDSIAIERLE
jgi:hypothetical protein